MELILNDLDTSWLILDSVLLALKLNILKYFLQYLLDSYFEIVSMLRTRVGSRENCSVQQSVFQNFCMFPEVRFLFFFFFLSF